MSQRRVWSVERGLEHLPARVMPRGGSDVPEADLAIVHKTINRWNGFYGERYGSVIIPISRSDTDKMIKDQMSTLFT